MIYVRARAHGVRLTAYASCVVATIRSGDNEQDSVFSHDRGKSVGFAERSAAVNARLQQNCSVA